MSLNNNIQRKHFKRHAQCADLMIWHFLFQKIKTNLFQQNKSGGKCANVESNTFSLECEKFQIEVKDSRGREGHFCTLREI